MVTREMNLKILFDPKFRKGTVKLLIECDMLPNDLNEIVRYLRKFLY